MKETKEGKNEKQSGKHKRKATIGDIIFRILIILGIFFSSMIAYIFYLQGVK